MAQADEREIKSICAVDYTRFTVSEHDDFQSCERITRRTENGQMAAVPWFDVWRDGEVMASVNAAHVVVVRYQGEEEQDVPF